MEEVTRVTMMHEEHRLKRFHSVFLEIIVSIHTLVQSQLRVVYVQLGIRRRNTLIGAKGANQMAQFTRYAKDPASTTVYQMILRHTKRRERKRHVVLTNILPELDRLAIIHQEKYFSLLFVLC